MYFWLTEHPGWVGGGWEKTFIKRSRNIFLERCHGLDDGVPVGGGGVLIELLVGGGVSKKIVHFLKIIRLIQDDGSTTFICREDTDGIILLEILKRLLFFTRDVGWGRFALVGKDARRHTAKDGGLFRFAPDDRRPRLDSGDEIDYRCRGWCGREGESLL